ncbi:MAG: N-acetyltransferase, partial [Deltaproteobacteria bacterium]|nr:N-acetyltransferase [Deltaproteobacteria bacterium]
MLDIVPPPQPTLVTERLLLRPLRDADAIAVAAGAGDKRVARFLIQVPSPYPITLARRWVRHRIEWWALGRGVTLAIA